MGKFELVDVGTKNIEVRQVGFGVGMPKVLVEIFHPESGENDDFDVVVTSDMDANFVAEAIKFAHSVFAENGYYDTEDV